MVNKFAKRIKLSKVARVVCSGGIDIRIELLDYRLVYNKIQDEKYLIARSQIDFFEKGGKICSEYVEKSYSESELSFFEQYENCNFVKDCEFAESRFSLEDILLDDLVCDFQED